MLLETYVCNTMQHIHYKLARAARLIHQSFKINLWQANVKHNKQTIMVLFQSIWDSRTGAMPINIDIIPMGFAS